MSLDIFYNWRFDPFTGVFYPQLIEEEGHTIEYHEEWDGYGIQLNEVPHLETPSSVIIIEDVSGGIEYQEVPRTTEPGPGEYRVDYGAATYYGTGRIQFDSSEDSKDILVTYYGLGTTTKKRYQLLQETVVPTNLGVEGNAQIQDDLQVDTDLEVIGDVVNNFKIVDNLYAILDNENIFNQLDSDLNKRYFSDANSGVNYSNDGSNGKLCLEFVANGSNVSSKWEPFGVEGLVKMSPEGATALLIHAKKTVSLTPGQAFQIQLRIFDKDLALVSTETILIDDSEMNSGYNWYYIPFQGSALVAAYYGINMRLTSSCLVGTVKVDYLYGGNVSPTYNVIERIMSYTFTPNDYRPLNQRGHYDIVWLNTFQLISVTSSTPANFLINESYRFKGAVKSVICIVLLSSITGTNFNAYLNQYEGDTGTTLMQLLPNIVGFDTVGSIDDTNLQIQVELPISFITSYFAGLRLAKNAAITPTILLAVQGFRIK